MAVPVFSLPPDVWEESGVWEMPGVVVDPGVAGPGAGDGFVSDGGLSDELSEEPEPDLDASAVLP